MRYLLALNLFLGLVIAARAQQPQPNVIIILADDLGWSDLGCYGSLFHETPILDSFSKTAIRFTNAYAPAPRMHAKSSSFNDREVASSTWHNDLVRGKPEWTNRSKTLTGKFETSL